MNCNDKGAVNYNNKKAWNLLKCLLRNLSRYIAKYQARGSLSYTTGEKRVYLQNLKNSRMCNAYVAVTITSSE